MSAFGEPSMPTFCAETPTQTKPPRMRCVCAKMKSGAASSPLDTFSHSTTTVPLKRAGSIGRRTTMRVLYAAVGPGVAVQCPSSVSGVALV